MLAICIIVGCICLIVGFLGGFVLMGRLCKKEIKSQHKRSKELSTLLKLSCSFSKKIINGEKWNGFIGEEKINSIAIYGMGELGKVLENYLVRNGIKPLFVMDNNKNIKLDTKYDIYAIDDDIPDVDLIIVTPVQVYETVSESLNNKCTAKCLALTDFVEMME